MEILLIVVSSSLAILGLYLASDYGIWEAQGKKAEARIDDFEKGKIIRLPIVVFNKEDGSEERAKAERIDQFIYLISRPQKGEFVTIIVREDSAAPRVRVHGYLPLAAATLLVLPLIAVLGLSAGKIVIAAQVMYVGMFALIMVGGLALLKFIYRS